MPPFDKVLTKHFEPAVDAAMDECRAELVNITSNSAPASFENTVAAFENAGRSLNRVRAIYCTWSWSRSDEDFQVVVRTLAPKLAAFDDEVVQNTALFSRIATVYRKLNAGVGNGSASEQARLTWHHYSRLVLAGAELDEKSKLQVSEVNQDLARRFASFSDNVLGEEENGSVEVSDERELAGLSQQERAEAAAAATAEGLTGKWLIANTRSAVEPLLMNAERRDLRERVWRNFVNRGANGGARDNSKLITQILRLRQRRAHLLGYATHAHWRLNKTMAGSPDATLALMSTVWRAASLRVEEEVADMQALTPDTIEPWDYRFYAEKVRLAKYALDESELKPYLQLSRLREAMFWVAKKLFALSFTPATQIPTYHSDVKVWEVTRPTGTGASEHVGLWYFDPYSRPGKRSGAWMSSYRDQENSPQRVTPLVSNNTNFIPPAEGCECLLSWDNATTLFHEFGHALHGLLSQVAHSSLSGTNVARDFVEFPSQLLEHWLAVPEVLERFALHVDTGEPMPKELRQKVVQASRFNQGFATVEYLSTAWIDMKLHLDPSEAIEPAAFEQRVLKELGMPREVAMRHRLWHLNHVFSSDGYSAGYYSYLWADALTADAFEGFLENDGPMDPQFAKSLLDNVLRVGNTVESAAAYRAFRGKDPSANALMRKRGFA